MGDAIEVSYQALWRLFRHDYIILINRMLQSQNLRMVKTYRTPQTLRSFARLFTTLLPPFFAPQYAQLAMNLGLGIGISFAIITALCLNALLEGIEILEE